MERRDLFGLLETVLAWLQRQLPPTECVNSMHPLAKVSNTEDKSRAAICSHRNIYTSTHCPGWPHLFVAGFASSFFLLASTSFLSYFIDTLTCYLLSFPTVLQLLPIPVSLWHQRLVIIVIAWRIQKVGTESPSKNNHQYPYSISVFFAPSFTEMVARHATRAELRLRNGIIDVEKA